MITNRDFYVNISNSPDMKDILKPLRKTENLLFKFFNDALNEITLRDRKTFFLILVQ